MAELKWKTHADLAIKKTPTVGREEFLDHMTFQKNTRPLFTEIFGPLIGLKEEWEEQGAVPEELDFSAFRYQCESRFRVPVNCGRIGGFKEEVIEDTEEVKIWKDNLGRTMKLPKKNATVALPLDYPVRTMDDWLKIKPMYEFSEKRFAEDWLEKVKTARKNNSVAVAAIPGGFDEPRQLLGEEHLCISFYEQPELIHDILETIGDTAVKVLDRVSSQIQIDMLSVHEDMAGKSGPLAGPVQIKEFIKPYYQKVWKMLESRGARIFDQDSDGDMNPVIDAFLDTGLNCMHPMEPEAGMDIVKIREKYGSRLAFYGGIDKYVLAKSKEDIIRELEYKIPSLLQTGGCVFALDHRIPGGTPLENYKFYIEKVWEIFLRS
ncbi:MAG: uroporphyrinogen decarboxylase family protein [Planctomycetota bacterium]|jgi:uroporphyrinogen-III decarboxylase